VAGTCIALHRTTTVSQAACLDLSSATHALLYIGLRRLSVGIICEKFVYVKFASAAAAAVDVLFYLCTVALCRFLRENSTTRRSYKFVARTPLGIITYLHRSILRSIDFFLPRYVYTPI